MSADLPFTPCSPDCPAVTGKPLSNGSPCPMANRDAHDRHSDSIRSGAGCCAFKIVDGHAVAKGPCESPDGHGDCCANLQCCWKRIEEAGMVGIFSALVEAADGDRSPVIHVGKRGAR